MKKKIAVLLPTYNAATYIKFSVDSILNQTFSDFDLYIYDDCSQDNTEEIINNIRDSRIYYIKNEVRLGIAKTLNKGLSFLLPHYKFIARMDADDWAHSNRFKIQINYLEKNRDIVLCGTQGFWLKDLHLNPSSGWEYPVNNNYIKFYLLFTACFGHSSILLRSHFFLKNQLRYNEEIETCEDWDLWIRVIKLGKVSNLPDFLMKYRIHENSNHRSFNNKNLHLEERASIISRYWTYFDINLTNKQIFDFYYSEKSLSKKQFLSNIIFLIDSFNNLSEKAKLDLTKEEYKKFSYFLSRRLLDYWKRTKTSRFDIIIWNKVLSNVKFIESICLIKNLIK